MMIGAAQELLAADAARTPEWYEARRQGVTASEISTILGLSRFDSSLALYYRKRGELDDEDDNYRMALGRELEPYVLRCFEDLTGLEISRCGLVQSLARSWQLATPDAVIGHIPAEAKTALSEEFWGPSGSSVVPLYYRAQLLWQMDCLGADHGYMCVVFMRSGEPRWYRIEWDSEDIGVMRMMAWAFMEAVEQGDPPEADGSEASMQALRRRFRSEPGVPDAVCSRALRRSYAAALRARRVGDDRHNLATNRIRQAMGNSARLLDPDGEIVATRRGPKDALYPARGLLGE
jgi:putative phage-type endonuclease